MKTIVSVVFISPPKTVNDNQAVIVREDDQTHQALKLMGQSIGIVALGRRIVLIEGEHGSLDKQTYGAILKGKYPNLVLVPSGGRGQVQSFGMLVERILGHSVWGVEFFMLCDRDAVPAVSDQLTIEATAKGRLKLLNRYHLENYFLDEDTVAAMFSALEPSDSWLVSPEQIRNRSTRHCKKFHILCCGIDRRWLFSRARWKYRHHAEGLSWQDCPATN
jgi:hypothetical protein